MSHPGDDGWSRPGTQQLHDAFEAMQLGRRMMGMENGQRDGGRRPSPSAAVVNPVPTVAHPGEEPSWVASLVGMPDRMSPQPPVGTPVTSIWQDRDAFLPGQLPQSWPEQNQFMGGMSYLQQQQQLLSAQGYNNGTGVNHGFPVQPEPGQYQQPYPPAYMGTPFSSLYPTPPASAMPAQDRDVIELARRKGLNPATFNCRPLTVSCTTKGIMSKADDRRLDSSSSSRTP